MKRKDYVLQSALSNEADPRSTDELGPSVDFPNRQAAMSADVDAATAEIEDWLAGRGEVKESISLTKLKADLQAISLMPSETMAKIAIMAAHPPDGIGKDVQEMFSYHARRAGYNPDPKLSPQEIIISNPLVIPPFEKKLLPESPATITVVVSEPWTEEIINAHPGLRDHLGSEDKKPRRAPVPDEFIESSHAFAVASVVFGGNSNISPLTTDYRVLDQEIGAASIVNMSYGRVADEELDPREVVGRPIIIDETIIGGNPHALFVFAAGNAKESGAENWNFDMPALQRFANCLNVAAADQETLELKHYSARSFCLPGSTSWVDIAAPVGVSAWLWGTFGSDYLSQASSGTSAAAPAVSHCAAAMMMIDEHLSVDQACYIMLATATRTNQLSCDVNSGILNPDAAMAIAHIVRGLRSDDFDPDAEHKFLHSNGLKLTEREFETMIEIGQKALDNGSKTKFLENRSNLPNIFALPHAASPEVPVIPKQINIFDEKRVYDSHLYRAASSLLAQHLIEYLDEVEKDLDEEILVAFFRASETTLYHDQQILEEVDLCHMKSELYSLIKPMVVPGQTEEISSIVSSPILIKTLIDFGLHNSSLICTTSSDTIELLPLSEDDGLVVLKDKDGNHTLLTSEEILVSFEIRSMEIRSRDPDLLDDIEVRFPNLSLSSREEDGFVAEVNQSYYWINGYLPEETAENLSSRFTAVVSVSATNELELIDLEY